MADQVIVREVGLRDGLQLVRNFVETDIKSQWISEQAKCGFSHIEVTSFVPPKLLPQFADAEDIVTHANTISGLSASALVLNVKGAQRALDAGARTICFVLSASEMHNQSNVRCSADESMAMFAEIAQLARDQYPTAKVAVAIATSFGCSLQGHVSRQRVQEMASELAMLGAKEITLADTVGYANPQQVEELFALVSEKIGNVPLAAHFHDTRGMGLANVTAALKSGVRIFDASLGGLGGCPFAPGATGNISTEDTVYMLESMGYATGISMDRLLELRAKLEDWLPGEALQGSVAKAGPAKTFAKDQA